MTTKNRSNGKLEKVLKNLGKVDVTTCMVATDSLTPSPFNPQIRTQLAYLKDLRASMEKNGFWPWSPVIVDINGTIIDGHRRWTVANLCHISMVPVTIVDADPDVLWAEMNGTRMDLSGKQVTQALANGLKTVPAKYATMIERLEKVVGKDGIKELGDRGISPFIVNVAVRIARYCDLADDNMFIASTIWWIANHRLMSTVATNAIKTLVDPHVIESAIRGNRTLRADYK